MEKNFETQLNDLHADMVSVCVEYCNNRYDQLYIHVINENNTLFADFFYRIDGEMLKKSKICADENIVNPKRQQAALSELIGYLRKLFALFNKHGQPQPSEIKLVYDNKKNGEFSAEYSYEPVTSKEKSDRFLSQKWFESLKI